MLVLKKQGRRRTPQTLAPLDTLTIKGNPNKLGSEATTFYFKHVFPKDTRSSPQLNWPFPHVSSGLCSATGELASVHPHHTFSLLVNASFAELRVYTGPTCLATRLQDSYTCRDWLTDEQLTLEKTPSPTRLRKSSGIPSCLLLAPSRRQS